MEKRPMSIAVLAVAWQKNWDSMKRLILLLLLTHRPFTPGPTLYHALVHECGRSMVEEAIDELSLSFADQEGEGKGA